MSTEASVPSMNVIDGLRQISITLTTAAALAKAAVTCAESGSSGQALRIALGLEEPIREANTLLNMVALIQRLSERGSASGDPP